MNKDLRLFYTEIVHMADVNTDAYGCCSIKLSIPAVGGNIYNDKFAVDRLQQTLGLRLLTACCH